MNKKCRLAIITILIVLFSSVMILAYSTDYYQSIEVLIGHVKLVVNGQPLEKETILYNGTTYVPLRDAAEILGNDIIWDETEATAYINAPVIRGNSENLGKGTLEEPYRPGDIVLLSAPGGNEFEVFFDEKLAEQTALTLGEKADPKYFSHNFYEDETLFMAKLHIKMLTLAAPEELFADYLFSPYSFDGTPLELDHTSLLTSVRPSYYASPDQTYFWVQSVIKKDSPILIGFNDAYYGLIFFDLN